MGDKDARAKLWSLIRDIHIATFITYDATGNLRSRPVATQQSKFDGYLWFFTRLGSATELQTAGEQTMNLSYTDPLTNRYVSLSGVAILVQDKDKFKELWNPIYHGWFPLGFEDPNLKLIKIRVEAAEFWDSAQATMVPITGSLEEAMDAPTNAPIKNQLFAATVNDAHPT
jgi:general stress protein 26